ncbi:DUF6185 family protein [Streptomyces xanthii]|uniref:Uncharacterized protein n=1 Tax=Streptomyces xanthii TaxID=2768069 RepID=A0A7H1BI69_9ACTN|nr:DUF6185 family protein [Streptomyces xanthii]QNS08424.1 hypothetical protein IAG42_35780 [Streptomyces xanthii]
MLRQPVGVWVAALIAVITLTGTLLSIPHPARAADGVCGAGSLKRAKVSASLKLDDRSRTQTKLVSRLTIEVPDSWPYATDLLLGENSEGHRRAMRCLLRGDGRQAQWWAEWRAAEPRVNSVKGAVRIRTDTYGWADAQGTFYIGPWDVSIGKNHWTAALNMPLLAGPAGPP